MDGSPPIAYMVLRMLNFIPKLIKIKHATEINATHLPLAGIVKNYAGSVICVEGESWSSRHNLANLRCSSFCSHFSKSHELIITSKENAN